MDCHNTTFSLEKCSTQLAVRVRFPSTCYHQWLSSRSKLPTYVKWTLDPAVCADAWSRHLDTVRGRQVWHLLMSKHRGRGPICPECSLPFQAYLCIQSIIYFCCSIKYVLYNLGKGDVRDLPPLRALFSSSLLLI